MSAGVSFTNTVKYALDAKLVALHGAALVAAEKKDPLLANSYGDILQKRLLNKPGQEYEREGDAKSFQQMMDTVENAWRRMVIKEEGDDKLTMDDVKAKMALDNTMYQNLAMQARLPYQLREDPEDSDDDPPIELSYRVVSFSNSFMICSNSIFHQNSVCPQQLHFNLHELTELSAPPCCVAGRSQRADGRMGVLPARVQGRVFHSGPSDGLGEERSWVESVRHHEDDQRH